MRLDENLLCIKTFSNLLDINSKPHHIIHSLLVIYNLLFVYLYFTHSLIFQFVFSLEL